MSAEILRRAAALMRERAETATEGPWVETVINGLPIVFDTNPLPEPVVYDHELTRGNAEHIASWHPAVALTVADALDDLANDAEAQAAEGYVIGPRHPLLNVARTFLGEAADD